MGNQKSWDTLKGVRRDEMVLYCHQMNVARWRWKTSMDKKTYNDLVSYVHRINIECGEGASAGWDDMIPDNGSYEAQRQNGFIAIPERLLKGLGLLGAANATYFRDWRPT